MSRIITHIFIFSALACCCLLPFAACAQDAQEWRDSLAVARNDTLKAKYLSGLGQLYRNKKNKSKSDLDSAFYLLGEAFKLNTRLGLRENSYWNQYYTALLYLDAKTPWRANELTAQMDPEKRASLYANLCWHYTFRSGEYSYDLDTAVMYGEKAILVSRRENWPWITRYAAHGLSAAYIEWKKSHMALAYLPEVDSSVRYTLLKQISFEFIARKDKLDKHLDSAEIFANASLKLGREINRHQEDNDNYYYLALVELYRKRYYKASQYIPRISGQWKGDICMALASWMLREKQQADSARFFAQSAFEAYTSAQKNDLQDRARQFLAALAKLPPASNYPSDNKAGKQRFRQLMDLARKYQSTYPLFDANQLSIAINYLHAANQLAASLRDDSLQIEGWREMGKTQCMIGEIEQARYYFSLINDKFAATKNNKMMAENWMHFGSSIRRQRPLYADIAYAYGRAREYYAAAGSMDNALMFGMEEASFLAEDARPDEARQLLLQLSVTYANQTNIAYKMSRHFALLAQLRGDLSRALHYTMDGLKKSEQQKDTLITTTLLTRLASIYHDLGQHEKSIETYRQVLFRPKMVPAHEDYEAAVNLAELLIQQRGPEEAMAFVKQFSRQAPPSGYYPTRILFCMQALCHEALNQYMEAEHYFQQAIGNIEGIRVGDRYYSMINFYTGRFYLGQKKFTMAAEYLNKAIRFQPDIASVALTNNAHYMLFQCDSALGNYRQAIGHYQLYKYFTDSLFNVAKSRQISELQIQYETEKKDQSLLAQEQEIRLRGQSIEILTQKGQLQVSELEKAMFAHQQALSDAKRKDQDIKLQEKSIAILRQQSLLQESKLEQERLMRNVSFAGAGLLVVIIGLLINGYRLKQNHNLSLQDKQQEIGRKNASLEKLLTEKEWLLKEIHHRVKNNLQIVMSLRNSQSAYLQNDAALVAIRDSQHRVQAISLIHKKLYQSDNVGLINMPHYIHELVEYLNECFGVRHRIRFHLDIAPIQIDVSQAVPLGLILNEAITNSIKYAFPPGGEGAIAIHLEPGSDGQFSLTVADNGKGLPEDFDLSKTNSLGMSLMRGLSDDLGGSFTIRNRGGAEISIQFGIDAFTHPVITHHQENIAV
ncbi:histidine kinase dimerization/phosphoacceptor domain -containing protein [Chitinophaga sp.]|uniref:histidine kinase dimerization/phosphoacceptor domain -containing protein n=1 Tax=Chitinophaga sp. TaxID=1869181 RepID=UPI002621A149|nr:histidine kinase dimerization/phosphoacceptor domain -containing protein [uncultured Chitinophaga sp.]